jgi:DNA ligase (NAD+)
MDSASGTSVSANLIADRFGSLARLLEASADDIADISGIGGVVATAIHGFTVEQVNRELVASLEEVGVQTRNESVSYETGRPLSGLTLVLTGRLGSMTRPEAEEQLRKLGANVTGSVSKKTSAVIAGAEAGGKADKAQQLGVPLLDEEALALLLEGNVPAALADAATD